MKYTTACVNRSRRIRLQKWPTGAHVARSRDRVHKSGQKTRGVASRRRDSVEMQRRARGGSLASDSVSFLAYAHLAPSYFRRCEYRKVRGPSPREVERVPKINDEPIERHFMRRCGGGEADKVERTFERRVTERPSSLSCSELAYLGKLASFSQFWAAWLKLGIRNLWSCFTRLSRRKIVRSAIIAVPRV